MPSRKSSAYALVTDRKNALIAERPQEYQKQAGQCILPGGGIEQDETVQEAASRELEAETGIKIGDYVRDKDIKILSSGNRYSLVSFEVTAQQLEDIKALAEVSSSAEGFELASTESITIKEMCTRFRSAAASNPSEMSWYNGMANVIEAEYEPQQSLATALPTPLWKVQEETREERYGPVPGSAPKPRSTPAIQKSALLQLPKKGTNKASGTRQNKWEDSDYSGEDSDKDVSSKVQTGRKGGEEPRSAVKTPGPHFGESSSTKERYESRREPREERREPREERREPREERREPREERREPREERREPREERREPREERREPREERREPREERREPREERREPREERREPREERREPREERREPREERREPREERREPREERREPREERREPREERREPREERREPREERREPREERRGKSKRRRSSSFDYFANIESTRTPSSSPSPSNTPRTKKNTRQVSRYEN